MFDLYGFLCDCPACSLEGEERRRDNDQRRLLKSLDNHVEKLLYVIDTREDCDENGTDLDKIQDIIENLKITVPEPHEIDEEDLNDIQDVLFAIKILILKLHLMNSLGFKVVTQLSVYKYILEICEEWDLAEIARDISSEGARLARILYGETGEQLNFWSDVHRKLRS